MPNKITESLLSAINVMVEKNNNKLKFDKTIEAIIVDTSEAALGKYRVKYQNSSFIVYGEANQNYKPGDHIFVLVPEGDFNSKKLIAGTGSRSITQELVNFNEEKNLIEEVGKPAETIYNISSDEIGLWKDVVISGEGLYVKNIFNGGSPQDAEFIKYFNQDTESIIISADFRTELHPERIFDNNFNYGLIFTFVIDGQDQFFYLNKEDMYGDYKKYLAKQNAYFIAETKNLNFEKLKSIDFFVMGVGTIRETDDPLESNEIFVSNIHIQACEKTSLQNGYLFTIQTPEGIFKTSDVGNTLDLYGNLSYFGNNIAINNNNSISIKWFKRNLSVNATSPDFDSDAGLGWKEFAELIKTNKNKVTIPSGEYPDFEWEIKAVLIYKDVIKLSKEILIKNPNATPTAAIVQEPNEEANTVVCTLKNGETILAATNWTVEFKDGTGRVSYPTPVSNSVSVDLNLLPLGRYIKISCLYAGNIYNAIINHIVPEESPGAFEIIFNAEELYNNGTYLYNENGRTDLSERLEVLKFYLNGVSIEDVTWEWSIPNTDLMFGWINAAEAINGETFQFKVKPIINYNSIDNNVITLSVTYEDVVITKSFPLSFIKQGDQGTNGTDYILKVVPYNSSVLYNALVYNSSTSGWITGSIQYEVKMYKNGFLISDTLTNAAEVPTLFKNSNMIALGATPFSGNILTVSHGVWNENKYQNIIKITSSFTDTDTGEVVSIDYLLPIPIFKVTAAKTAAQLNPLIITNLNPVTYDSRGFSPQYNSESLVNSTENDILYTDVLALGTLVQVRENFTQELSGGDWVKSANALCRIAPRSFLDAENAGSALKVTYSHGVLIQPIVLTLNKYAIKALNAWDGLTVDINNDGGYVLSPQVGAGSKNGLNQFSGVLLGETRGIGSENFNGILGFYNGGLSYGLKADGTAFIGTATGGRIEFDGTQGIIQSANYSSTAGTKINLKTGLVEAYNLTLKSTNFNLNATNLFLDSANKQFSFTLGSDPSYFKIANATSNLFYLDSDEAYIRSANYDATHGMNINLSDGSIVSHTFKLTSSSLNLDSSTSQFTFKIPTSGASKYFEIYDESSSSNFLRMGRNSSNALEAYIQSKSGSYSGGYTTSLKIDLANGQISSSNTLSLFALSGTNLFIANNTKITSLASTEILSGSSSSGYSFDVKDDGFYFKKFNSGIASNLLSLTSTALTIKAGTTTTFTGGTDSNVIFGSNSANKTNVDFTNSVVDFTDATVTGLHAVWGA